jgi:hypothetical protein
MCRAVLGLALSELSADQLAHFSLHHLLCHEPHALADHIRVNLNQHLPDDLLDRHPVCSGHRRPPSLSNLEKSDDDERRGGRNYVPTDPVLHHATGRDPASARESRRCMRMSRVSALHPRSGLLMAGSSQGADVLADAYQRSMAPHQRYGVVGVALIGDPRFRGAQGAPINADSYNPRLNRSRSGPRSGPSPRSGCDASTAHRARPRRSSSG